MNAQDKLAVETVIRAAAKYIHTHGYYKDNNYEEFVKCRCDQCENTRGAIIYLKKGDK